MLTKKNILLIMFTSAILFSCALKNYDLQIFSVVFLFFVTSIIYFINPIKLSIKKNMFGGIVFFILATISIMRSETIDFIHLFGIITYYFLIIFGSYILAINFSRHHLNAYLYNCILIIFSIISLFTFLSLNFDLVSNHQSLSQNIFGENRPNPLIFNSFQPITYILFFLSISFFLKRSKEISSSFLLLISLISIYNLSVIASRALLVLLFITIIYFLFKNFNKSKKYIFIWFLIFPLLIPLIVPIFSDIRVPDFMHDIIFRYRDEILFSNREFIWEFFFLYFINLIKSFDFINLFFGIGYKNLFLIDDNFFIIKTIFIGYSSDPKFIPSLHNTYLHIIFELGLVGFFFFFQLIYAIFSKLTGPINLLFIFFLICFIFEYIFPFSEPIIFFIIYFIYFFVQNSTKNIS